MKVIEQYFHLAPDFLSAAENDLLASEIQPIIPTGSADSHALTNHKSENSEALDETSAVAKTPEETSAVQQVPLLPSTTVLSSGDAPTTVCGHLQLLFAQLQYSFRRYF